MRVTQSTDQMLTLVVSRGPSWGPPARLTLPQGGAGQHAVDGAEVSGEPARAGEAPPVCDGGDRFVGRVGGDQVVVGVVEPDPAQVFGRGGVQVPPD